MPRKNCYYEGIKLVGFVCYAVAPAKLRLHYCVLLVNFNLQILRLTELYLFNLQVVLVVSKHAS